MTPTSLPVIPPQPNLLAYGFGSLALFQTYTRASYKAAFGVDAPNWDPTLPPKYWFDTSGEQQTYDVVQVVSNVGSIVTLTLPAAQAASVNIPGLIPFPPYVVAPTDATRAGVTLNANYLSMQADAQALMTKLGGTQLIDEGAGTAFPTTYPTDEPRRLWAFLLGGELLNVGLLLIQENGPNNVNGGGIGNPGSWNNNPQNIEWVATALGPDGITSGISTQQSVPVPVRPLLPNEQFTSTLGGVQITRTDLGGNGDVTDTGFTATDRATLQKVEALLVQALGLPAGS